MLKVDTQEVVPDKLYTSKGSQSHFLVMSVQGGQSIHKTASIQLVAFD